MCRKNHGHEFEEFTWLTVTAESKLANGIQADDTELGEHQQMLETTSEGIRGAVQVEW